jgi:hypothetical protein
MRKVSLIMALFLVFGIRSATAQKEAGTKKTDNSKKVEMQAKKKAFISEKLALTALESEKFWSIYDEKEFKSKELRKSFKDTKPKDGKKIDDLSDAEVQKIMDKGFEVKEKQLALDKEYNQKFIDVIGVKRTAKLNHIEREFKKQMHEKRKENSSKGKQQMKGGK